MQLKTAVICLTNSGLATLIEEIKQAISVTNVMPAVTNTPIFNKIRTKLGMEPAELPPCNRTSNVLMLFYMWLNIHS